MLDTGCHPQRGFEPHQPPSYLESINEFKEQTEGSLFKAKVALAKAKDDMAIIGITTVGMNLPQHLHWAAKSILKQQISTSLTHQRNWHIGD